MLSSYNNMLSHIGPRPVPADRRWKPNVETAPNCPRCDSSNTKFCYYNNYSLSQPRYFCKGCRRYWTKGGSLRNVPVGGGCRKSRRGRATRNSGDPGRDPTPLYAQHGGGGARARLDQGPVDDAFLSGSPGSYHPADHPVHDGAVDGSNIDLAALYAKYLNQCPQPGGAGIAEPMDSGGSSSASSCDRPPAQFHAPSGQHVDFRNQAPGGDVDEMLLAAMNQAHVAEGIESASLQDPCSFEYSSLAMFMEANCAFPSDPCAMNAPSLMQEAAEYGQEFDSVPPVDCMQQQQQQLLQLPLHQSFVQDINGDQWSALDYSSLEGFYKL